MKIDCKDLLDCVERMTPNQRIRFCELLDPVEMPEAAVIPECSPPVGMQGPEPGSREHNEMFSGAPHGLFRPPSPDVVAQLLYGQMTGKKLEPVVALEDRLTRRRATPAECGTAGASALLNDALHRTRWIQVMVRWRQLFAENQVPMNSSPESREADLNLIEGILYDKGVKNLDPVRCACGCGYVIGCIENGPPYNIKE